MKILVGVIPGCVGLRCHGAGGRPAGGVRRARWCSAHIYAAPADHGGQAQGGRRVGRVPARGCRPRSWPTLPRRRRARVWREFETAVHGHRSSGVGLERAGRSGSARDMIVIGSAPGASNGRFLIGSTADQLLHGSHVPVALAPAGYRRVQPGATWRDWSSRSRTPRRATRRWSGPPNIVRDRQLTALTVMIRHR